MLLVEVKAPPEYEGPQDFYSPPGRHDDLLDDLDYTSTFVPRVNTALDRKLNAIEKDLSTLSQKLEFFEKDNEFASELLDKLIEGQEIDNEIDGTLDEVDNYCNYCNIRFKSADPLLSHLLDRHVPSMVKQYYCSICKYSSEELTDMKKHVSAHYEGRTEIPLQQAVYLRLSCDYCDYKTADIMAYQLHCLMCSNNPKNDNYNGPTGEGRVCHTCFQVFNNNRYMLKHVQAKHNRDDQDAEIKKFLCDECGRRFVSKKSLSGHKKIHRTKPGPIKNGIADEPPRPMTLKERTMLNSRRSPALSCISMGSASSGRATSVMSVETHAVEDMPDL